MASAAIELESFTPDRRRETVQMFSQEELDNARAEGFSEGRTERENEETEQLRAGLEKLAGALSENDEQATRIRAEAVAVFIPLLSGIVDALAPSAASQRLEQALTEELNRLAREVPPVRAHISCSETLREQVENCITKSGLKQIEVETTATDHVLLSLSGGSIEFSQEKLADQIRELIDEIKET